VPGVASFGAVILQRMRRFNGTWGHGIDRDAMRRELDRHDADQPEHPGLRRGISGATGAPA
jgi:hypothetical protein